MKPEKKFSNFQCDLLHSTILMKTVENGKFKLGKKSKDDGSVEELHF